MWKSVDLQVRCIDDDATVPGDPDAYSITKGHIYQVDREKIGGRRTVYHLVGQADGVTWWSRRFEILSGTPAQANVSPTFPTECPCGIHRQQCEYHRSPP